MSKKTIKYIVCDEYINGICKTCRDDEFQECCLKCTHFKKCLDLHDKHSDEFRAVSEYTPCKMHCPNLFDQLDRLDSILLKANKLVVKCKNE